MTPEDIDKAETPRHHVAQQYEDVAAELERAARHLRETAEHFRQGEVPRGCAHTLAALGHVSKVERQLRDLAELHATRSTIAQEVR